MKPRLLTATFRLMLAGLVIVVWASAAFGQEPVDASQLFTKTEVIIAMRDGVHLNTMIYAPKNIKERLPFILLRTPYGIEKAPAGVFRNYLKDMAEEGYIFVFQDIRGRFKSEGRFVMLRLPRNQGDPKAIDESTDTYDTIEWLLKNVPNNNGRVGMLGISYGGWLTVMAMLDPHPALKAVSPQASPADMFLGDDFHHNGAFRLSYGFEYVAMMETSKVTTTFKFDRQDTFEWYLRLGALSNVNANHFHGKMPTWNDFVAHPNYDRFWKKQAFAPYLNRVTVPTLNVAGWWDQEDFYGPLKIYELLEEHDTKNQNYLVVGPWNHGGWSHGDGKALGDITFDSATGKHFRAKIQAPWFAHYLKDKGKLNQPEALMFETGSNQWVAHEQWPPRRDVSVRKLYFHPEGRLSFEPPPATSESKFDSYVSDPAHPVPYRPRPIEPTYSGPGWPVWHVQDQRFVHLRPDVLSWETEPLKEDVAIAGDVLAHLFASTSGTDCDWVVKLIDVYPDDYPKDPKMRGYQLMVSGEVMRARFRKSFEKPELVEPNQVNEYSIDLHWREHCFLKGHRIMIQVQSSWFPVIDRNPQTYVENIFAAKDSDYRKAEQRIYRSQHFASQVSLPVIQRPARKNGASSRSVLVDPTAQDENGPPKDFDEYVTQALKDWEVPGLAIAIVKDDAVVLAKGYGVRKLGETAPITEKTLFAIASCSKAFTAAAVAMLVDEGKIGWDDPVAKHLHDFQLQDTFAGREITVRDLLCHRSGLPRYDLVWYGSAAGRDDILRRLPYANPKSSFRSQFGYQNIMFLAAGQVIPAATGKSWDEFVKQRIFTPLGMTSSNTSIRAFREGDDVATPHLRIEDKVEVIPWRNIDNAGPAGSINSSVADMAQWIRLQLNHGVYNDKRLLTTKAVNEMHTPQTVVHPEGMGPEGRFWELMHPGSRLLTYGLGWVLREYRNRVMVQHGGSIDGMRSLVLLVPDEKLGIVILTNRGEQLLPEAIGQRIADAYLAAPARDWSAELLKLQKGLDQEEKDAEKRVEKERLKETKPSLPPDNYAGTYKDNLYGEITVAYDKGKLAVRYGPSLIGDLEHWHHDTFRVTWTDRTFRKGLVTFRLDRKGKADEIRISQPDWGEEIAARRSPPTAKEPAIELKPEELRKFVGALTRETPPLDISVELLNDKLKLITFGRPVATLVPIKPTRFRVEGAAVATYLEFELAEGKIKQAVYERGDEPKVTLLPKK